MATQRIHAPAGSSDITHYELEHRSRAYNLSTIGMLSPTNSVDDRCDLFHITVFTDRCEKVGSLDELILRNPGDAFDHLRRVARILLFQKLEDTTRMLQ